MDKFCLDCNIKLGHRNKSGYCSKCRNKHIPQCPLCAQFLSPTKEHTCNSVDIRGDRHCNECGALLNNKILHERWAKICRHCNKKKWRASERAQKKSLKEKFGGKCEKCGYKKCFDALHFHHLMKEEKYLFSRNGGASITELKQHPERFKLLCSNCHIELHSLERVLKKEEMLKTSLGVE